MKFETSEVTLTKPYEAAATVQASDVSAIPTLTYDDPLSILGSAPFPDDPWWKRFSPSTIFVLLSCAIAILFLLHELTIGGALGFPTDEAWIDQVYARNFFHHVSFEFNPGERTAGPTAPFWIVFLSLGAGFFHDGILAAKLLGSIFLFLTAYYAFRLLRSTDHDYGTSLLGGVLAVTAGQLAWSELSGLESTLAAALVMGGTWWYFANPYGWRRALSGAIFALAALTRPETTIIFFLLLVYSLLRRRSESHEDSGGHFGRDTLLTALAFVLIIVPIALTNVALSGAIVPETFYASLGRDSMLVLLRHGHIGELLTRLVTSVRSLWYVTTRVYLPENPLFFLTIVLAFASRFFRRNIQRDRSDALFSFTAIVLLFFPYLRAVALGTDDLFGEYGRWMHFLLPLYAICGLASVRILLRTYLDRGLHARSALYGTAVALVVSGCLLLLLRDDTRSSFSTVKPAIDFILLIFFTGVLLSVALRYTGMPFFKRVLPHVVTEEERKQMTFEMNDEADHDPHLPETTMRVLRAALLILLAWNLSQLPRAANDFANDVKNVNQHNFPMARAISRVTLPTDVIASDAVGALGWSSERKIIDVEGRLTSEPSHNVRMLGQDEGLLKTLTDIRPQYFAMFNDRYEHFAERATSLRFFEQVLPTAATQTHGPVLYHLNYSALPAMQAR